MPTPNNFDEYMDKLKKVKLDPSRQNLKPYPSEWNIEQCIAMAVKEGNALLAAETPKNSVKTLPVQPSPALEDALGKMSDNPYIRARTQILGKMTALARSVIEKMENGTIPKDKRYDSFCSQVAALGDKLSSTN